MVEQAASDGYGEAGSTALAVAVFDKDWKRAMVCIKAGADLDKTYAVRTSCLPCLCSSVRSQLQRHAMPTCDTAQQDDLGPHEGHRLPSVPR